jgi:transposase InsO family protein
VSEHDRQGQNILRFRTDNGREYVSKELEGFFQSKGIIHELTPAYSHESNGVAERMKKVVTTLVERESTRAPLLLITVLGGPATNYASYWSTPGPTLGPGYTASLSKQRTSSSEFVKKKTNPVTQQMTRILVQSSPFSTHPPRPSRRR